MVGRVKRKISAAKQAADNDTTALDDIKILQLTELGDQRRLQSLLRKHHYLGSLKPVGERMFYAAADAQGHWLAVLVFSAAAKHLKHRDQWIGWTRAQRERCLSMAVNNSRFLILPHRRQPNPRSPDNFLKHREYLLSVSFFSRFSKLHSIAV